MSAILLAPENGSIHSNAFSFQKHFAAFLPFVHTTTPENSERFYWKNINLKTLLKVEHNKNAYL